VASISLLVNGRTHQVEADPAMPLLWVLRDSLGLLGTKFGCGGGFCGACTVHLDGAAVRACTLPIQQAAGRAVITIEGLSPTIGATHDSVSPTSAEAEPTHAVQRAWVELDVAQCGYCQAGQIMTAAALLARTPRPTDDQIAAAMQGNICRCGTYVRIREAVRLAARRLATQSPGGAR
jgi:isoquinoline 1-oxidoreductase subunit alpha